MRPIYWFHISDIHMQAKDTWSQDVVLKAMCENISRQRKEVVADFILVTGDLASSGKAEEYTLVADFFDALTEASGVPSQCIFCVPGNHDIDRDRQNLCFNGGREYLKDQNRIDSILAGGKTWRPCSNARKIIETSRTHISKGRTEHGQVTDSAMCCVSQSRISG